MFTCVLDFLHTLRDSDQTYIQTKYEWMDNHFKCDYVIIFVIINNISNNGIAHDSQVVHDKKKKLEGKMVRAERQVVLDMLFSAFEKHQYYNIKDLVDITKQPVVNNTHTHTLKTNTHNNIAGYTKKTNTPAHYPPCFVKLEQIAHGMTFTPVHTIFCGWNLGQHACTYTHIYTHTRTHNHGMNRYSAVDSFQLPENSNV